MVETNSFIENSLKELSAIKSKLSLLDKMAVISRDEGLWHALSGIRREEERLNELRKAYYFYE